MPPLVGYSILILLAGTSYGVGSSVLKTAYAHGFNVQDVTFAQFLIAAIMMWGLRAVTGRRKRRIAPAQWILLGSLGLVGAGTSFTYYESLTRLPASVGIVLLFQFAWIVLVIDIVVQRRLPSLERWIGMALIVAGTILAVKLIGSPLPPVPIWAILLGLLSAVAYSLTLYLSGYTDAQTSPFTRAALIISFSAVIILIPFHHHPHFLITMHRGLWFWGSAMALTAQVIPMLLMIIAIPRTGGRVAGVLGSVELPVAVLVARAWLGESVSGVQWLGIFLILGGIVVSELVKFRPRPATTA